MSFLKSLLIVSVFHVKAVDAPSSTDSAEVPTVKGWLPPHSSLCPLLRPHYFNLLGSSRPFKKKICTNISYVQHSEENVCT